MQLLENMNISWSLLFYLIAFLNYYIQSNIKLYIHIYIYMSMLYIGIYNISVYYIRNNSNNNMPFFRTRVSCECVSIIFASEFSRRRTRSIIAYIPCVYIWYYNIIILLYRVESGGHAKVLVATAPITTLPVVMRGGVPSNRYAPSS